MNQESTPALPNPQPTKPQSYYCWFKVVPFPGAAIKLPEYQPPTSSLKEVRFPNRPPDLRAGMIPTGQGSWQMDFDNQGPFDSAMYVEYIVVPGAGSLTEAQAWPYETKDGGEWIKGSLTHFLMQFHVV